MSILSDQAAQNDQRVSDEAERARRGDISELITQFRAQSPHNIIGALARDLIRKTQPVKNTGRLDATPEMIDRITARTEESNDHRIKFSVTIDPNKLIRSKGADGEEFTAGKNHDSEQGFAGDDEMRRDLVQRAIDQEQEYLNAVMAVLNDLRIPYVVPNYPTGGQQTRVTIEVDRHAFDQAFEPVNKLGSGDIDEAAKLSATRAFWQRRDNDRPELENGYTIGSKASEQNGRRSTFPLPAILAKAA